MDYKKPLLNYLLLLFFLGSLINLHADDGFLSEDDLYGDFDDRLKVVSDPLQPMNRAIFKFNDFIYVKLVRPVANGYTAVAPDVVEKGFLNFFQNLRYPVRLTGNLLQWRWDGARIETERFLVNSTLGIAGVYKAADHFKRMQEIEPEDVGQALGAWGIGEGPYLVLPFMGPSNVRDLFGMIGDRAVDPLADPFNLLSDWEPQLILGTAEFISNSPKLIDLYMQIRSKAIDPYSAVKRGYTDKRRAMIGN